MQSVRSIWHVRTARWLAACSLVAFASQPLALAPGLVTVGGVLKDAAGVPVNGTVAVTFTLYDAPTGGTQLFQQQLTVPATNGVFGANLGEGMSPAFDLTLFRDRADVWLGIRAGNNPEMTPRTRLGSSPWAAHAATAAAAGNGVPAGAVMFFDLPQCPQGWTPYAAAQGRMVVGVPSGGTLGATVGAALTNQEDRAHVHAADAPPTSSAMAGDHSHVTNPPMVSSTASGGHQHSWARFDAANHTFLSWQNGGALRQIIDWGDGYNSDGSGIYALGFNEGQGWTDMYTTSAGSHSHSVDVAATTSTMAGSHTHSVDIASYQTGQATGLVPYVQLIACKKT